MKTDTFRAVVLCAAVFSLVAAPEILNAQTGSTLNPYDYKTRGFNVNLSGAFIAWTSDDLGIDGDSGLGFGAKVAYNVRHNWGFFFSIDLSTIDNDYAVSHADLGFQYIFLKPTNQVRPVASLSLTGFAAGDELVTWSGSGVALGIGGLYFLTQRLAVEAHYRYTAFDITEVEFAGMKAETEHASSSGRLLVGLTWHF